MKISIIVPVYNAQAYIDEMLDSILSQSYENWELLLIISKSKDNSLEICRDYAKKNSRINVIEVDASSLGAARNVGVKAAHGEYIMFVDADDFLPDQFVIECFLNKAQKTDADIIVANYKRNVCLRHVHMSVFQQKINRQKIFGFKVSFLWERYLMYGESFIEDHLLNKIVYALLILHMRRISFLICNVV